VRERIMTTARMPLPAPWWREGSGTADARPARRGATASAPRESPVRPADCIPVRSLDRIVIVRVAAIVRLEADDNYVRIWADRMYLHKETLAGLCARLDPREFVRVHRSHAVRIDCVRELVPRLHGEYLMRLTTGDELVSGRSYRAALRQTFGLD
jgi:DNA-binding LytR/AlgR family response regulator